MAINYTKINFENRDDSKPDSYLVNGLATEIVKDNSGLISAGTVVNAARMNQIEEKLITNIIDEDNGKNYITQLKVVSGKPVLEYKEVL